MAKKTKAEANPAFGLTAEEDAELDALIHSGSQDESPLLVDEVKQICRRATVCFVLPVLKVKILTSRGPKPISAKERAFSTITEALKAYELPAFPENITPAVLETYKVDTNYAIKKDSIVLAVNKLEYEKVFLPAVVLDEKSSESDP